MSQKTNPRSVRLGLTHLWSNIIQNYGFNFKITIILFYIYLKFVNILSNILFKSFYLFSFQEILFFNSKIIINIWCLPIKHIKLLNYLGVIQKLIQILKYWVFGNSVSIRFYFPNLKFFRYSWMIVNYGKYLSIIHNYSPKKITSILVFTLNTQLNHLNIFYTKMGPVVLRLRGFKIVWVGCFETTKLQMAEMFDFKIGLVGVSMLNKYVDFSTQVIHTKLGSVNLKIWLFFEIT